MCFTAHFPQRRHREKSAPTAHDGKAAWDTTCHLGGWGRPSQRLILLQEIANPQILPKRTVTETSFQIKFLAEVIRMPTRQSYATDVMCQ